MPLLLSKRINPYAAYAVWKISETPDRLVEMITPPGDNVHPHKRSEWMVTRIMVKYLCETFDIPFLGLDKDEYGKPLLANTQAEVSISHSFPLAAALINLRKPCGVDLERPRVKMIDVQHKYLHAEEEQYKNDLEKLTRIWAAKEVLYKVHARGGLSFKEHMHITFENGQSLCQGHLKTNGHETKHPILIEEVMGYRLAYSF